MSISKRARETTTTTTTYLRVQVCVRVYIESDDEDLRCCCSLYGIIIFLSRFVVGTSEAECGWQVVKGEGKEEREGACCETDEFAKTVVRKKRGGGGGGERNGELIKLISMLCHSSGGFLERVKREEIDEKHRGRESWSTIFVGPLVNRSSKAKAG